MEEEEEGREHSMEKGLAFRGLCYTHVFFRIVSGRRILKANHEARILRRRRRGRHFISMSLESLSELVDGRGGLKAFGRGFKVRLKAGGQDRMSANDVKTHKVNEERKKKKAEGRCDDDSKVLGMRKGRGRRRRHMERGSDRQAQEGTRRYPV